MKYYSEITKRMYDTVEDLQTAEFAHQQELDKKKLEDARKAEEAKKKAEELEKRRKELKDLREAIAKANNIYSKALEKFVNDYPAEKTGDRNCDRLLDVFSYFNR